MKKLLVFSLIFFFSCDKKDDSLSEFICNKNSEYWNFEWPRKRAEYYGFTFKFSEDSTVIKYSFSKVKNTRVRYYDSPFTGKSKWNVSKDSILIFFDSKNKITKISKDTIYLTDMMSNEKNELIRVKGSLNIIKP